MIISGSDSCSKLHSFGDKVEPAALRPLEGIAIGVGHNGSRHQRGREMPIATVKAGLRLSEPGFAVQDCSPATRAAKACPGLDPGRAPVYFAIRLTRIAWTYPW